jgi:hypothetical protein
MEKIPNYIAIIFIVSTIATLLIVYWVVKNALEENIRKKRLIIVMILFFWLFLQAFLSYKNIYINDLDSLPPKIFLFGVLPNIITIILLFKSRAGQSFIDALSIEKLTYLNIVRIPIEVVLFQLFFHNAIPQIMTYYGWNFDIIFGITAPFVIYFGFIKKHIDKKTLLWWNIIGLCFLIFIFIIALLSAPFPLQCFAINQPNIGLLYFPFSWLPTFIVPIVIFAHLVSIRQLIKNKL